MQERTVMLTVKEAAVALGIDERSVREKLTLGSLKGTKKTIGQKDKWFISRREIDAEMTRRGVPVRHQHMTDVSETPAADSSFDPDTIDAEVTTDEQARSEDTARGERMGWHGPELDNIKIIIEQLTEQFTRPLVDKVEAQGMALAEKDRIIEDKDRQLRLLPDFQKQAEDQRKAAEQREFEAEALKKQVSALQAKEEAAEAATRKVAELEQAMDQLRAEKEESDASTRKVAELEQAMDQLRAEKEESDASTRKVAELEQSMEQLRVEKEQKESNEKVVAEKLAALTEQLDQLRKPWWKKWFSPSGEE